MLACCLPAPCSYYMSYAADAGKAKALLYKLLSVSPAKRLGTITTTGQNTA